MVPPWDPMPDSLWQNPDTPTPTATTVEIARVEARTTVALMANNVTVAKYSRRKGSTITVVRITLKAPAPPTTD
jgi:hypothetical protein